MKKILLFISSMFAASLYAQEPPPLYLEYDASGNQVLSDLVCVNCPGEATEKHILDQVAYYPNPVAETLIIAWENTNKSHITAVKVYSLNGKQVTSRSNLNQQTELSLNFINKAAGIYNYRSPKQQWPKEKF